MGGLKMKKILSIILVLTIVFSVFSFNITSVNAEETNTTETLLDRVKSDFDLVWSDEFNGDTLDTTKWQFDGQMCRRNSEIQIYADSMEDGNLQFDGNNAIIVPKVETRVAQDGRKYKYTSAEISTQGKQSWKYGYFEVRAKASIGKNICPAIWMMGYDYPSGTCDWPYSGEIDIIEGDGGKSVSSTLHHAGAYGQKYHAATGVGVQNFEHNLNEEFHNYWLFWTDKYLISGADDNMHQIVDITKPRLAQSFRTFEHWLILNVAMGMFASSVNDAEEEDWKMWIDYVRVYQPNKDEDYDKYIALSAKELIHNGYELYDNVHPMNSNRALDLTIEQGKLSPGKYDVYAEVGNNSNGTETFINGQKTYDIAYVDHGKEVGNQAYIGSIDLQEDCSLNFTFKGKNNSSTTIEKLLFVKTNETKTNPIVANKNSCFQISDYIEVSTEDELLEATKYIKENGTIKLLQDITLTKNVCTYNTCTIDLNGKTITSNNGEIQIYHEEKITTIKNGKIVIINDAKPSFIYVYSNKYNVQVKIKNIDFQINTSKSGEIISYYNAGIVNSIDNCTFTFTDKVSNTNPFRITKNTAIYNNCTFHLKLTFPTSYYNQVKTNGWVQMDKEGKKYSKKTKIAYYFCDKVKSYFTVQISLSTLQNGCNVKGYDFFNTYRFVDIINNDIYNATQNDSFKMEDGKLCRVDLNSDFIFPNESSAKEFERFTNTISTPRAFEKIKYKTGFIMLTSVRRNVELRVYRKDLDPNVPENIKKYMKPTVRVEFQFSSAKKIRTYFGIDSPVDVMTAPKYALVAWNKILEKYKLDAAVCSRRQFFCLAKEILGVKETTFKKYKKVLVKGFKKPESLTSGEKTIFQNSARELYRCGIVPSYCNVEVCFVKCIILDDESKNKIRRPSSLDLNIGNLYVKFIWLDSS